MFAFFVRQGCMQHTEDSELSEGGQVSLSTHLVHGRIGRVVGVASVIQRGHVGGLRLLLLVGLGAVGRPGLIPCSQAGCVTQQGRAVTAIARTPSSCMLRHAQSSHACRCQGVCGPAASRLCRTTVVRLDALHDLRAHGPLLHGRGSIVRAGGPSPHRGLPAGLPAPGRKRSEAGRQLWLVRVDPRVLLVAFGLLPAYCTNGQGVRRHFSMPCTTVPPQPTRDPVMGGEHPWSLNDQQCTHSALLAEAHAQADTPGLFLWGICKSHEDGEAAGAGTCGGGPAQAGSKGGILKNDYGSVVQAIELPSPLHVRKSARIILHVAVTCGERGLLTSC